MDSVERHEGDGGVPWGSWALYVVLSSSLIGVMGVSLISPVLPDLRGVFGVGDSMVGLVITVYTLPGVFLTPFLGLAADRFGRKRVLVPLLFLFGVAGVLVSVAGSFEVVLLLRFLQGVGGSGLITLAVTLIGDLYADGVRDSVMGLNAGVMSVGAAFYPLLGGFLAALRWSAPFVFFGVAVLVGFLAVVALEEQGDGDTAGIRSYVSSLGAVFGRGRALAIFAAIFTVFFVFYGLVLTALPLLLSDSYGLGSTSIGLVLSMVSVAAALVASQYEWVSGLRRESELVALGFMAYGVSLVGVWFSGSPVGVAVSLLLFGVGFGVVMPSIDTALVTLVSTRLRAGVMGMRTSVLRLGQTLGPLVFTYAAESVFASAVVGYRVLMLVVGVAVLSVGVISYVFFRA